jgi:hypothetical protein
VRRLLLGFLGLLAAAPVLAARDGLSPAEQVKALEAEYKEAADAYLKAMRGAKTPEEREQVVRDKSPQPDKFAARFMEIAEKNPKDPAAVDALIIVVTYARGGQVRERAVNQLFENHLADAKLARAIQGLRFASDKASMKLLMAILEKNPGREIQAQACAALAQAFKNRAAQIRRWKDNPDLVKTSEGTLGKEYVESLLKEGPEGSVKESAKYYDLLAEKYGDAKQTAAAIEQLGYSQDKASETLLHKFLDKGKSRAVQGQACFALAQCLKRQADTARQLREKPDLAKNYESMLGKDGVEELLKVDPDKLTKESEKLFERVVKEFADLPHPRQETIGKVAENVLFKMRNLVAGKPAPEIEAEDVDGKPMKLSDYRGKVVLLDFWGNW